MALTAFKNGMKLKIDFKMASS